jgi:hypothetical protein
MRKILSVLGIMLTGCGGSSNVLNTPGSPSPQNANISGEYQINGISTKNNSLTSVFANLSQHSTGIFGGDQNTTICFFTDSCFRGVQLTAMVTGDNVIISVLAPGTGGQNTITFTGIVSGTNMAGTYTDSQDDAGNWTANPAATLTGTYRGSAIAGSLGTVDPIPLGITMALIQQPDFSLSGSAMATNSRCIAELNFDTGQAFGGAFFLHDLGHGVAIAGSPPHPTRTVSPLRVRVLVS